MVTPGYFARPDLTAAAFDAQGFCRTSNAVGLADPDDLNAGLVFRGRIAEDFKGAGRAQCHRGSAGRIEPLLVMARPAGLDDGEITGKGYVNQRQVLANRAALVEQLYAQPVPAGLVVTERTA